MKSPPRMASVLALAATLLLGPVGAAPVRPAPKAPPGTLLGCVAPWHGAAASESTGTPHVAPDLEAVAGALMRRLQDDPARAEVLIRSLCVLAMTMNLSPVDVWCVKPQSQSSSEPPDNPPPDNPTPEVVPPPPEQPPPIEQPPPPPPPRGVPEPATLVSALVGSGLAAFALWRRRRRSPEAAEQADAPCEE